MKKFISIALALLICITGFTVYASDTVKEDLIANLQLMLNPYFGNGYNYSIAMVIGSVEVTEKQASQVIDRVENLTSSVTPRGAGSTLNDYSYFEMLKMYSCATDCFDILGIKYNFSALGMTCELKYDGQLITDTINEVEATCTKTGYSGDVVCPACWMVYSTGTTVPKYDHIYTEWVIETAPTYESEGLRYKTCVICNDRVEEVIEKLTYLPGDVNLDGKVNVSDAVVVSRYSGGLTKLSTDATSLGNVNGDSVLNILDAVLIAQFSSGIIDSFDNNEVTLYEREVIRLVNEIRVENGLNELTENLELSRVARYKSQDMKDNNYFDHTSPVYGTPFEMMNSFEISYSSAGENIAQGYATPEEVVEAWMNSPGHRANILSTSYTQIGVGYVADGRYWTQMFIG